MTKYEKKKIKCKPGVRSKEEEDKIHQYLSEGKTSEEIATLLNRNIRKVKEWIEELHIRAIDGIDPYDVRRMLDSLHKAHFWFEISQQFTQEEIRYFEGEWVSLMSQFKEDVLPAETLMLKQLITINILINRSMKERKRYLEEIEKIQVVIDKEYKKSIDNRDSDLLSQLEQQVSFARSSITQYTTEYAKLLGEQNRINKDLKATRDQRIKRIEDSKTSFTGWLKALEDEKYRERVGFEAEVMKIAKHKAEKDLSEFHSFADNKLDRPLLTPEVVLEEEDV